MPPKRENPDESIELARVSREVREQDEKPQLFNPANMWFRGLQVLAALGLVYGFGGAVQNYNHRLIQQDERMVRNEENTKEQLAQKQREIDRLKRTVVYTAEWKAWHKVFLLKNAGKLDSPDPADFTIDRTE